MGWFDKTILGSIVTPYNKKVEIALKEGYQYNVSPALQPVLSAFCEQQQSLGFDHDLASVMFMAVAINSLEPDGTKEMETFAYLKNVSTIGGIPYHTQKQNQLMHWKEIKELYIEASSKHLPEWVIEELWSETNNDSLLLAMFEEIESKDMEKFNEYFKL
tara:strand:- start:35 stop:514 length:480 start_codon:yes stop_codon:yes gene_type:complete